MTEEMYSGDTCVILVILWRMDNKIFRNGRRYKGVTRRTCKKANCFPGLVVYPLGLYLL